MMQDIAGMPYLALDFDAEGKPENKVQIAEIEKYLAGHAGPATLLVIAHGWRNSAAYAAELYATLLKHVAERLPTLGAGGPTPAIIGVFWPSLTFPEQDELPEQKGVGGAASKQKAAIDLELLAARLKDMKNGSSSDSHVDAAIKALDRLGVKQGRADFVTAVQKLAIPEEGDDTDFNGDKFRSTDAETLFDNLDSPSNFAMKKKRGGGGVASLQSKSNAVSGLISRLDGAFSGVTGAAWRMLNYLTYYQMKERAGTVGRGLAQVLSELKSAHPDMRLHLVGHSFGARLVTMAAKSAPKLNPISLCLLQGAFSHNGFGTKFDTVRDGFFRSVVKDGIVSGAILVTHTANDEAVGIAYAIASRLSRVNASGIGDKSDAYGGIGRNGALYLSEGEGLEGNLLKAGEIYHLSKGRVHNFEAGDLILNHGDVTNPAVANLVAHALAKL
jgi:hypothetical protein